jgi:predicted transport protein
VVHADPTFTQGPNCVVCIDDLNAKLLHPYVNPNLKYHFLRTTPGKAENMINVGSYGATDFYVCASTTANCPFVANQDAFDGRMAFSDFVLFVYEAMSISGGAGGSARSSSGGSFVYSVR